MNSIKKIINVIVNFDKLQAQLNAEIAKTERLTAELKASNEAWEVLIEEVRLLSEPPKETVKEMAENKFKKASRISFAKVLMAQRSFADEKLLEQMVESAFTADNINDWAADFLFSANEDVIKTLADIVETEQTMTYEKMLHFICLDAFATVDTPEGTEEELTELLLAKFTYPEDLQLPLLAPLAMVVYSDYATDKELSQSTLKLAKELAALV